MEFLLFSIIPLGLLVGSILGFVSYRKVNDLQARLDNVERKLKNINVQQSSEIEESEQTGSHEAVPQPSEPLPNPWMQEPDEQLSLSKESAFIQKEEVVEDEPYPAASSGINWAALIQQYWMVFLGGVCLVFSGIFLVRYSIEHGMLGPAARTTLGLLFGGGLIIAGEKLRRSGRLEAGVHAVFVASGSLVIYSALLVGFHMYNLFSAQTAFACMALMSAFSMLLALKHGPLMAGMGLLGAFLVPVLVSTGSNNIEAALLYSFIVTCGSLWLQRYVYRSWLWWGTWGGALGWLLLSLNLPEQAQGVRALYIAALGYVSVALSFSGVKLRGIELDEFPKREVLNQITSVFVALTAGLIITLHVETFTEISYPALVLLPIVAALVARNNLPMLKLLPVITVLPIFVELYSMDISFFDWEINIEPLRENLQASYIIMLVFITAAFVVIGGKELSNNRHSGYWASFILFSPLIAIVLAYLRISGMQGGLDWALPTLVIGGLYAYLLNIWRDRKQKVEVEAALAIAAQTAISIACFFAFSGVTLTLILSAQLIGLAYIDRKVHLPVLPVIIKVMIVLVIVRLTLNPWIVLYEISSLTLLLTYVGCLISCVVASRIVNERPELMVWLHSASAHLLVLTLAVVTRYLLYSGNIFAKEFSLTEASIYICSWAAIGIIYEWKSRNLESHKRWYRGMGMLHIAAAAVLFVFYNMFLHNPLWGFENIGGAPIFNILLVGYAIPVVLSVVIYKRIEDLKKTAGAISVLGFYLFSTLEIRHLWNGGIYPNMPVKEGELYTYSLVWLLISVAIMIYGAYKNNKDAQRIGIVALLIVIAKAFFWDMRDLDGLWRVVSFLGLGLSLLGVAYLFNKIKVTEEKLIN